MKSLFNGDRNLVTHGVERKGLFVYVLVVAKHFVGLPRIRRV